MHGLVIDSTGADPIPDGVVTLQGTRIVAVGHKVDFAIPGQAAIVDAMGGTIPPDIIDAHTPSTADRATRRLDFLLAGATAICDMGAPLDSMSQFEQADAAGPSARSFRAGPIITAPDGYPDVEGQGCHLNYEVVSAEEARAAVIDLVGCGADVIKIALEPDPTGVSWPVLSA